jgi:hypothetical protein
MRTTPDVSLVADPATGAWIADPYNLDPSNPFEVVGGTSLSAPAWAGLVALANQGRAAAGEGTLNSSSPTDTQQAIYMLPQSDYNTIGRGDNGYTASAGYNLVTGLGTPVANLLVPDLVAYRGAGTTYSGSTVAPLQNSGLVNTGSSDSGPMDVFSVFDALVANASDFGSSRNPMPAGVGDPALTARDRGVANRPDGAANQGMAHVQAVVPANAAFAAPVWATGSLGMMPLADVLSAHDVALAGWASSGPGSAKRAAIRMNDARVSAVNTRTRLGSGRARTGVLARSLVDWALEGLGEY